MSEKQAKDRQAITDLLARWIDYASKKDVDAVMGLYADDICAYDAIGGPLAFVGRQEYRAHWSRCLPGTGEVFFQPETPVISISGHLAVTHFLIRCGLRHEDGSEQASWMRATKHLEKRDGHWRIAHEHFSVPFDFENGQAQFGLEP